MGESCGVVVLVERVAWVVVEGWIDPSAGGVVVPVAVQVELFVCVFCVTCRPCPVLTYR